MYSYELILEQTLIVTLAYSFSIGYKKLRETDFYIADKLFWLKNTHSKKASKSRVFFKYVLKHTKHKLK